MPPDWPRGPEGVRRAVAMLRGAFPDLRYTIEEVLVEGETIAARWVARGTHTGELRGPMGQVGPTGRPRFPRRHHHGPGGERQGDGGHLGDRRFCGPAAADRQRAGAGGAGGIGVS